MPPKKIYLQCFDEDGELDPVTDEITWCTERINPNDVVYVLEAAEHRLQSDSATGCPFCGVSAEDIANFNQATAEPPSA
jgi:hypothetical protein